jgi:hypothetical protein
MPDQSVEEDGGGETGGRRSLKTGGKATPSLQTLRLRDALSGTGKLKVDGQIVDTTLR